MRPSDIKENSAVGLLCDALQASAEPVEIDHLDGRILSVNNAWCRFFGLNGDDVIGNHWDSTSPARADLAALTSCWAECMATGHSSGIFDLSDAHGMVSPVSLTRWLCGGPREERGLATSLPRT